jgi:hypothetical protein
MGPLSEAKSVVLPQKLPFLKKKRRLRRARGIFRVALNTGVARQIPTSLGERGAAPT